MRALSVSVRNWRHWRSPVVAASIAATLSWSVAVQWGPGARMGDDIPAFEAPLIAEPCEPVGEILPPPGDADTPPREVSEPSGLPAAETPLAQAADAGETHEGTADDRLLVEQPRPAATAVPSPAQPVQPAVSEQAETPPAGAEGTDGPTAPEGPGEQDAPAAQPEEGAATPPGADGAEPAVTEPTVTEPAVTEPAAPAAEQAPKLPDADGEEPPADDPGSGKPAPQEPVPAEADEAAAPAPAPPVFLAIDPAGGAEAAAAPTSAADSGDDGSTPDSEEQAGGQQGGPSEHEPGDQGPGEGEGETSAAEEPAGDAPEGEEPGEAAGPTETAGGDAADDGAEPGGNPPVEAGESEDPDEEAAEEEGSDPGEAVVANQEIGQLAGNDSTVYQSASGSATNIAIVLQTNLQIALNLLGVDAVTADALVAAIVADLEAALLELPLDSIALLEVTDGDQVVQTILQLAGNESTISQVAEDESVNIAIVSQMNLQVAVNIVTQPRRRRRIRVHVCPIGAAPGA